MGFVSITVIGNLGGDPELKYTPQGVAVCEMRIASNIKRGDKEETQWFKATAWRGQAENCAKYLKKGSQIYIDGELTVEQWHDKEQGARFALKIDARNVQFLGGLKSSEPAVDEEVKCTPRTTKTKKKTAPDDIPF